MNLAWLKDFVSLKKTFLNKGFISKGAPLFKITSATKQLQVS